MSNRAKLAVAFVETLGECERLQDEADLSRLRLAEAREALRPFAAYASTSSRDVPTLEDYRRAKEVLDRG